MRGDKTTLEFLNKALKAELFDPANKGKSFAVLEKYFKTVSNIKDVKTLNNICYFNYRANRINKHIHTNVFGPPQACPDIF